MKTMAKALALAGASIALVSAAEQPLAPNSTRISDGIPPVRYRGDVIAVVHFVDDVTVQCGAAPAGYVKLACSQVGGPNIAMPNPCPFAATERYARIMCHEMAHVSGWPATHGD